MDYVFSVWYLFRFCTAWHQGCEVFAICLLGICLDLLGYLPSALPENWKEMGYRIMGYAPCGCTSTPLQHSKPRWLSHTQKPKKNKKEQKDKHRCCLSVVSTHSSLCSRTQGESSYGPPARGQIRSHVPSHAKCRLKVSLDHHASGSRVSSQQRSQQESTRNFDPDFLPAIHQEFTWNRQCCCLLFVCIIRYFSRVLRWYVLLNFN